MKLYLDRRLTALEPRLTLRMTGPEHRCVNRQAEFDLEVSNTGNTPATHLRVVDTPFVFQRQGDRRSPRTASRNHHIDKQQ